MWYEMARRIALSHTYVMQPHWLHFSKLFLPFNHQVTLVTATKYMQVVFLWTWKHPARFNIWKRNPLKIHWRLFLRNIYIYTFSICNLLLTSVEPQDKRRDVGTGPHNPKVWSNVLIDCIDCHCYNDKELVHIHTLSSWLPLIIAVVLKESLEKLSDFQVLFLLKKK